MPSVNPRALVSSCHTVIRVSSRISAGKATGARSGQCWLQRTLDYEWADRVCVNAKGWQISCTHRYIFCLSRALLIGDSSLRCYDGDGNENVQKSNRLNRQNNNSALAACFFCTFLCRRENAKFHVLWRTWTSDDEIFFPFLNLHMIGRNSAPE